VKFNKLRLAGFKSFVDPAELHIEPGLTGVVGPNGCGKSNLLEALRWVMGESSYKAMRGSGMEDVIFSGTANRPARNMAEVVAFLDNSDRTAPPAFNGDDALEISRRIERDAGSAYRINGRDTRARDVQLLFADASTGAQSPALVRQGQISEIINAKPQARRKILEEAAGISGLHKRRHEAELRLKAAETNLLRLDDVIAELESQHAALKRQARQATRYRNLSSEIRKSEALILHMRWDEARRAAESCLAELQEVRRRVGECTEDVGLKTGAQTELAGQLPALREREAIEAAALNRINSELATLDAEERQARMRIETLETSLTQIAGDLAREQASKTDMSEALARIAGEEKTLEGQSENGEARAEAKAALERARTGLAEVEEELNALTRAEAERKAAVLALKARCRELETRKARLREQQAATAARLNAARSAVDESALARLEQASRAAGEQAEALEQDTQSAESAREQAEQELSEHTRRLENARREAQALKTEARTLSNLLSSDDKDDAGGPRLIEEVKLVPGYEAALAALLGDDLEARSDESAPVHWRHLPRLDMLAELPPGVDPLSEFVEAPKAMSARLMQTGIVAADKGAALQPKLKPGQRLISKEGDVWRWDGFTAAADAPSPAARRLEGRNRLDQLAKELAEAEAAVTAATEAHEAAQGAAREARQREKNARGALRAGQQAAQRARDALARGRQQAESHLAQISALKETAAQIEADLNGVGDELAKARDAEAALPPDETGNPEIEKLTGARGQAMTALATAQAEFEGLEREARARAARLESLAFERKGWQDRAARAEAQIATLLERQGAANADLTRLMSQPQDFAEKRNTISEALSRTEAARNKAGDLRAAAEARQAEFDRAAREAERALSQARELLGRAETRLEAAREKRQDAAMGITDKLSCSAEQALEQAGFAPGDSLPAPEAAVSKLERLRAERERMGGVNLRASEEADEIQERLEGMRTEKTDLEQAIAKLRGGIGHLNRKGRERLLGAFDDVNGHFRDLFTKLFGGGRAELKLTESDDPLEAGLEIEARPPGKRPQSMSLLSGGEQTLTALALIFAVFLTNPSPICVLDEIDAPLDDANVERVCDLLDDMSKTTDTRFLVITHHPYTMARMKRLFGVTMAEKGVSQLVSVDLETAERLRDTG